MPLPPRSAQPLLALFLTLAGASPAKALDGAGLKAATDGWNALLGRNVRPSGGVDYASLEAESPALDAFLTANAKLDFRGADDRTKKAAYINLYNAGMIHNLLRYAKEEKIPVKSAAFAALEINKLKVSGGNLWSGDYTVDLGGHHITLDDIEHNLLRGQAEGGALAALKVEHLDPRIHAAVNCAAVSCPRLLPEAYRPETVDARLSENMQGFVSSEDQFHKIDDGKLAANSIVYWYYEDFDKQGGAGRYLASFLAPSARDHDWKVKHLTENFDDRSKIALKLSSAFDFHYDWRVNDLRNKP
jgi:hypothetical protein